MIPDLKNTFNNTIKTCSELYNNIRNNIQSIMQDQEIKEMLDPKNNTTTQKCLENNEDEDMDSIYSFSYFITMLLILDIHGISLDDA